MQMSSVMAKLSLHCIPRRIQLFALSMFAGFSHEIIFLKTPPPQSQQILILNEEKEAKVTYMYSASHLHVQYAAMITFICLQCGLM